MRPLILIVVYRHETRFKQITPCRLSTATSNESMPDQMEHSKAETTGSSSVEHSVGLVRFSLITYCSDQLLTRNARAKLKGSPITTSKSTQETRPLAAACSALDSGVAPLTSCVGWNSALSSADTAADVEDDPSRHGSDRARVFSPAAAGRASASRLPPRLAVMFRSILSISLPEEGKSETNGCGHFGQNVPQKWST
jgi:hypothetical protein